MNRCTPGCKQPTPFQAHCTNEKVLLFHLTTRDSDSVLAAKPNAELHQGSIDSCGISADHFADLNRATPGLVQGSRLPVPGNSLVEYKVVASGQWTQVCWSVVCSIPIEVVNVLTISNPVSGNAVLVGFDVRPFSDFPSETNVPMAGSKSSGSKVRYFLARTQGSDSALMSGIPAWTAKTSLSRTRDQDTTLSTRLSDHEAILQVRSLCHRTFGGVTGFDTHRIRKDDHPMVGGCIDPEMLGYVERDGVWRQPMDHDKILLFRSRVEGKRGNHDT